MLAAPEDSARAIRKATMTAIVVYRDRLLPASEVAFMRRQYAGFTQLVPQWVGCQPDDVANAGLYHPILVDDPVAALLFKQLGVMPKQLKALQPTLVHAQFGKGGALALPLAEYWRVPLVVTFHGGDAFKDRHYRRQWWPSVFQRRWERLKARASLFVCVSDGVRDKLILRGVAPDKLAVIPIGSDTLLAVFPHNPAPEHLLFVGRFVEKKGIFVLLEAIKFLRGQGVTTPVVLAGSGPLLATAQLHAARLADVTFLGWQSATQVSGLMARAYALIVPSIAGKGGDAEGLPSVAVEAMGMAVPVIASEAAGLNGIAGVVVKTGEAAPLAEAMASLVANPERRDTLARQAFALAHNTFSAPRQSQRLESRLIEVIQQYKDARHAL